MTLRRILILKVSSKFINVFGNDVIINEVEEISALDIDATSTELELITDKHKEISDI